MTQDTRTKLCSCRKWRKVSALAVGNITALEEKKITELLPMAVGSLPYPLARRTTTGSPVLNGKERTCNCVKTHSFNCENGISTPVFKPSAGTVLARVSITLVSSPFYNMF